MCLGNIHIQTAKEQDSSCSCSVKSCAAASQAVLWALFWVQEAEKVKRAPNKSITKPRAKTKMDLLRSVVLDVRMGPTPGSRSIILSRVLLPYVSLAAISGDSRSSVTEQKRDRREVKATRTCG